MREVDRRKFLGAGAGLVLAGPRGVTPALAAGPILTPDTARAALEGLSPGTHLVFAPADYRFLGPLIVDRAAGTTEAPIRLEAASPGVRLAGLALRGCAHISVSGFEIEGARALPEGWRDMPARNLGDSDAVIDPFMAWDGGRAEAAQAKFPGWFELAEWDRTGGTGVAIVGCRRILVDRLRIARFGVGIRLARSSAEIAIRNSEIHHCLDGISGAFDTDEGPAFLDSVIEANHLRQIFREGIRLNTGARGNLVAGNLVEFSGHSHIVTWRAGASNRILGNTVRHGGYYTETMRWPGGSAISVHSAGPQTLVEGNTISHHVDATLRDGNGIIIDYTSEGPLVANNLIVRVMGSGITSTHSQDSTIVHNTIVSAGYQTPSRRNGVGVRMSQTDDIGHVIVNNIISACPVGGLSFMGTRSAQRDMSHNLFDLAPGRPFLGDGHDPALWLTDIGALRADPKAAGSLAGDPLFRDAAAGDFRLAAGSPARRAGRPMGIQTDHDGKTRDPDRPSLGAFE